MPLNACYWSPDGELHRDLTGEEIETYFKSGQGLLWVDILDINTHDGDFLAKVFSFHPLAIEDCISTNLHPPKVDDFDSHIFVIVHGINYAVESEIVQTTELAFFLGSNFLVTSHKVLLYSVENIRQNAKSDKRIAANGADSLTYTILDALIDNVMPTIDSMIEIAGDIEEEVIHDPRQSTLEAILKVKRSTIHIHRVMAPQRELLNRISRGDYSVIKESTRIYFRDIYDHSVRIEDLNQSTRDMTDNALATYLSSIANRQNEIMKILSIVAAIFLPLTLVAGIYGMNFVNMPELQWTYGYYVVLIFMGLAIIFSLWLFRARGWINWGRKRMFFMKSLRVDRNKIMERMNFRRKKKRGKLL
ncbi:magnesium/cobalt transporter CorA [Chloroflexota bacterium]